MKTNTKSKLISSLMILVLCVTMFAGSTYAWFTDEVVSGNNIIQSGKLDVELYDGEGKSVEGKTDLFDGVDLWEPGAVAYENLTVANEGTLALTYDLAINFNDKNYIEADGTQYKLSDVLKVAVVPGGVPAGTSREEAVALAGEWNPLASVAKSGKLEAGQTAEPVGVIIYWLPTDNDNNWNLQNDKKTSDGAANLEIDLGIKLVANQKDVENDSFGSDYDAGLPVVEVDTAEELQDALSSGRRAKLTDHITAEGNKRFEVEANEFAVIDLNGYTLTSKDGGGSYTMAIYVNEGAKLILEDSGVDGKVVSSCYGVYVKPNATFVMNGGTIEVSGNGTYDYGVIVWNGTFVMNGGAINAKYGVWTSNYYRDNNDSELPKCKVTIADGCAVKSSSGIDVNIKEAVDTVLNIPETLEVKPGAATADELQAALNDGGNVVLTADIDVSETTFTVPEGKKVTLYLNGHDITYTAPVAENASYHAIVVKGELAVMGNGTIALYDNSGAAFNPNCQSTAISVSGGTLTLNEGVTVLSDAGAEMAYAVDVNTTSGESVLNINGATLQSSYIGVRLFNNNKTEKAIVIYNSGIIQGEKNGYDIWAQEMSNPAENAVVNIADGITCTTENLSGVMYYID